MTPFRVLVVDDSRFMRQIFSDLIERDHRFQVIGTAVNGREAVMKVKELDPDVVTMDIEMPVLNGLDALKEIMNIGPRPVIMLSGVNEEGMKETILALEFGAFDFIRKPSISNAQDIDQVGQELLNQLQSAVNAKERRALWEEEEQSRQNKPEAVPLSAKPSDRRTRTDKLGEPGIANGKAGSAGRKDSRSAGSFKPESRTPEQPIRKATGRGADNPASDPVTDSNRKSGCPAGSIPVRNVQDEATELSFSQLVAVGCSTGGPRALKCLLEGIPRDFPAPLMIVQHMPPNFTKSLAQRLDSFTELHVVEAEHGMALKPGWAYIAPGGSHMKIKRSASGQYTVIISREEPYNSHRPSVDVMFKSLLPLTSVKRHLVLMTGMGSDGARMMKELYDSGVTSTFAESEKTCVVYGMPRSAVELGCVSHVLPLGELAAKLVEAVKNGK